MTDKFAVISYKCMSDWFLTNATQTVGCNRSLSPNTIVFALIETSKGYFVGFCGQIKAKIHSMWACESAKRNSYECVGPIALLGNLTDLCQKTRTHPKIFRSSKMYGYPKHAYISEFQTIHSYVKNQLNI